MNKKGSVINLSGLRDMKDGTGVFGRDDELKYKELYERIKRDLEIDTKNYKGNHNLYGENEEEFKVRVQAAINDLKTNFDRMQLEALKYFYFILKITDNVDPDNPLFMDIEAFEDIVEPFIVLAHCEVMKENMMKLNALTDYAQRTVEDILISDFIFSPYKSENEGKRFICVTPELNYSMENLLDIPKSYKIQTDIDLKEGGRFHSAGIVMDEDGVPFIRMRLKYNKELDPSAIKLMEYVDIDVSDMAEIYYYTECKEGVGEEYLIEKVIKLLMQNIVNKMAVLISSEHRQV